MQIKLKPNQYSNQPTKVPVYPDWEAVEQSNFGDVQSTFIDECDAWLIMGRDGKSITDYFIQVQPCSFVEDEAGELDMVPIGQTIWVRHQFLYDMAANKIEV